jgi:hypothetical protein
MYLECGEGVYEEDELQFGNWMIADEQFWRAGTPGVRGRTPRGSNDAWGRGSMGGRGNEQRGHDVGMGCGTPKWKPKVVGNQAKKRDSAEAGMDKDIDDEVHDTASSP